MVMEFEMTNAPSTFVTLMNNIFKPLLSNCVIIYLDNIIVFSKTKSQHKEDLKAVFQTLWENQLFANPSVRYSCFDQISSLKIFKKSLNSNFQRINI